MRGLLERGRRVRALVYEHSPALDGLDIERVPGNVLEPVTLAQAFEGVDVVFHLAAMISINGDPRGMVGRINVTGTRNVAAAARAAGVRRMVHCSSIHAFDLVGATGVVDETSARASSRRHFAYDRSKHQSEQALHEEIARGLDAVIVNPTGVIGPFDFAPSRMGRVLIDLYHRRVPAMVRGGFDFVDVRDVVSGMLAAQEHGRTGENYILSGRYHRVSDIASGAYAVTGKAPPAFSLPPWLVAPGVPIAACVGKLRREEPLFTFESLRTLSYRCDVSSAKATRELGFSARELPRTLHDTYSWFSSAGMIH